MNERIKKLADEAARYSAITALPTGESGDKLFVEKFAQLIVKECANYITEYYPHSRYEAFYMKKHFGVEE